jgi:hypothetical protein
MKTRFISFYMSVLFSILAPLYSYAQQELLMTVIIDATLIPDMQSTVVVDMQKNIASFLNDRKWTNDTYQQIERIKGTLSIQITQQVSVGSYVATLQVVSNRTVYGTTYETSLLNFIDKNFNFDLAVGQPLNFNDNIYTSNLTSMLAFYAYIILALDYDSFGKLSGQPFVDKAYNVANIATQAGGGWATSGDPNNRFSLIDNLYSQLMLPFRENFYSYHRLGLDAFLTDPDGARLKVMDMLNAIKKVNQLKPYSILTRSFFLAKKIELFNIFRNASDDMKNKAVPLLREVDPLNSEYYSTILKL